MHFANPTGMRASESFNLTWNKIDLPQKLLRLEGDTKTSEPRVFFLCDQAYGILKPVCKVKSLDHKRYNTVDDYGAKSAYHRLDEFLSQEQDQNVARTKKCSRRKNKE
ncbi:MAG: tyrosine-type recombinase/integrase [Desulfobaccales bacterium]